MDSKKKTWIIGTRGSALALAQACMVRDALQAYHPDEVFEIKEIVTTGDRRTDVSLAEVAAAESQENPMAQVVDKGVFIKELEQALVSGEIDMAVHSMKDMPSVLEEQFALACVLPRADVHDVLISKVADWKGNGVLATGSVRRRMMAGEYFANDELKCVDIRGNVQTRLRKLAESSDMSATILAKAGMQRLGIYSDTLVQNGLTFYVRELPLASFVPAAGQGVIGIEILDGNLAVDELVRPINNVIAWSEISAERTFLARLGASCSTPVGVHAVWNEGELTLRVKYFEGAKVHDAIATGTDPVTVAHHAWMHLFP